MRSIVIAAASIDVKELYSWRRLKFNLGMAAILGLLSIVFTLAFFTSSYFYFRGFGPPLVASSLVAAQSFAMIFLIWLGGLLWRMITDREGRLKSIHWTPPWRPR